MTAPMTDKHTPGPWGIYERLSASENHRGFVLTAPTHKGKNYLDSTERASYNQKAMRTRAPLSVAIRIAAP